MYGKILLWVVKIKLKLPHIKVILKAISVRYLARSKSWRYSFKPQKNI